MRREQEKNIPEQPGPTCPMIDEAQSAASKMDNNASEIESHANRLLELLKDPETELSDLRDDLNSIVDLADEIQHEERDVVAHTEDARDNAANIREWGQGWKDEAIRLEEGERDAVEEVRSELQSQIDDLEEQVSDLTDERDELWEKLQSPQRSLALPDPFGWTLYHPHQTEKETH